MSYTVTYTALPGGISQTAVVSAPTTHVALRGLEEYTEYSILVFASTMKGDGNASDPIIVTTNQDSKLSKAFQEKGVISLGVKKCISNQTLENTFQLIFGFPLFEIHSHILPAQNNGKIKINCNTRVHLLQ